MSRKFVDKYSQPMTTTTCAVCHNTFVQSTGLVRGLDGLTHFYSDMNNYCSPQCENEGSLV